MLVVRDACAAADACAHSAALDLLARGFARVLDTDAVAGAWQQQQEQQQRDLTASADAESTRDDEANSTAGQFHRSIRQSSSSGGESAMSVSAASSSGSGGSGVSDYTTGEFRCVRVRGLPPEALAGGTGRTELASEFRREAEQFGSVINAVVGVGAGRAIDIGVMFVDAASARRFAEKTAGRTYLGNELTTDVISENDADVMI